MKEEEAKESGTPIPTGPPKRRRRLKWMGLVLSIGTAAFWVVSVYYATAVGMCGLGFGVI